jgi:hypothetical protein
MLKTRGAWTDVFQALKQNNCKPRLVYSEKLFFKIKGEKNTFHDKHELKQLITTNPALQKNMHNKGIRKYYRQKRKKGIHKHKLEKE